MILTLACKDLGSSCEGVVSGSSVAEIVEEMGLHAMEIHDYAKEQVESEEFIAEATGADKQSSRPASLMSSRLDV